MPRPEEDDVRLVPRSERAEKVLVRLGADLDGVGDDERRLLFRHRAHLLPSQLDLLVAKQHFTIQILYSAPHLDAQIPHNA